MAGELYLSVFLLSITFSALLHRQIFTVRSRVGGEGGGEAEGWEGDMSLDKHFVLCRLRDWRQDPNSGMSLEKHTVLCKLRDCPQEPIRSAHVIRAGTCRTRGNSLALGLEDSGSLMENSVCGLTMGIKTQAKNGFMRIHMLVW